MKVITPKTLAAGGVLALAILGGAVAASSLVGTAAAQVIGGGAATTQNGPGHGTPLFTAAATYIGITEQQLRDQLAAGKSMADVAIANGKTRDGLIAALTQAEGDRIAQLVDQKGLGPMGGRGHGRGGPGFGMVGKDLNAAATYLGISEQDLRAKLRSGQSLAAIANATAGKSRDGLIQALVAAEKDQIEQAKTAGRITADQATQLESQLTDRVTRQVDQTGGMPHGGRF